MSQIYELAIVHAFQSIHGPCTVLRSLDGVLAVSLPIWCTIIPVLNGFVVALQWNLYRFVRTNALLVPWKIECHPLPHAIIMDTRQNCQSSRRCVMFDRFTLIYKQGDTYFICYVPSNNKVYTKTVNIRGMHDHTRVVSIASIPKMDGTGHAVYIIRMTILMCIVMFVVLYII